MIRSLWIAKTGLEAQQTQMDVITNNLANVGTNGFKRSRAVFEDLLYQTIRQPGAPSSQQTQLPSGLQLGTGVRSVAAERLFTQGNLQQTSNNKDVAIQGLGFFQVLTPEGSLSAQGIASRAAPALTRTLWDVAQHGTGLEDAVRAHDPGVALSRLSTQALGLLQSQPAELDKLSQVLRELSPDANFWLLDCDLQTDNPFVLPELSASEVVVLVSNTPTSIKSAYTEMKEFQARFGRRQYQLLVLDASALQAQTIGKNMALAVNRYLASQLLALGNVPPDAHWSRAVQLGRAIVDAFPKAPAAVAFREITARLVSAQADAPHPSRAQARPTATLEI